MAALSTAAVLATTIRWRWVTVVVASLVSLWMWTAVVFLHWHYPTDALAGLAYGVGVVLVTDGAAWKVAVRWAGGFRRRPRGHRPRDRTAGSDDRPPDAKAQAVGGGRRGRRRRPACG